MFSNDADIISFLRENVTTCGEFHTETLQQVLDAVAYVINNNIPGDFVEIGVYKGVMVMAMCAKLKQMGITDRYIYLYDTFEGMVEPSDKDKYCHNGLAPDVNNTAVMSRAPIDEVKFNLSLTGYPENKIHYVIGDICKTDLEKIPSVIAFLRLDTDWYESTKFELLHFVPNVAENGVITQDDYNWWKGATDAVNEYLSAHQDIVVRHMKPHGIWWFHTF